MINHFFYSIIIIYISFSFVANDFNPFNWDIFARGLLIAVIVALAFILQESKQEKENE